jgi:hypothetical protein
MSLVSKRPVLNGSLKSVRLVSLKSKVKNDRLAILTVMLAFIGLSWTTAEASETWQSLTDQSAKLIGEKQYDRAESYLNRANEIVEKSDSNKSVETLLLLAVLFNKAAWHDKEVNVCRKIVDKYAGLSGASPNQLLYYKYILGRALLKQKNYKEALTWLEPAVLAMKPHFGQNNPYLASTLNTLAEAYKNNNQLSKAQILEKEADGIFQTFMDNLNRKIKSEWNPPKSDSSKKAVSMFGLNAEGKFENIKLTKPSSSPALNEACLNALRTTDKMPITTPSFYKIDIEPICIEFSFDYRNYGGAPIASSPTWPTTEKISNGKVATYESQSNHSFENRKKELEQETSKDAERVKVLLEQKEQLSDQNLLSLFIYTEKLREINQFGKTNELTRMMQKRNDCQIADSPPNLIMRSIEPLDLARQGNVIDAENKLKSIIQSSQFEKIESSHIRNHLLKKYGDLLYKQNKVEQANALYAKIRN